MCANWMLLLLKMLTDGGDSGDNLAELELVEDGGLTSGVESDHKNTC